MSLTLQDFAKTRPVLYHLTAQENLAGLLADQELVSASRIIHGAGRHDVGASPRRLHVPVSYHGRTVKLRDQAPLHRGNVRSPDGFTFEDLVRLLNSRVFFWPGTAEGPISYGRRHFERYKDEHCAVLVIPTLSLFHVNPASEPEFCKYNSGSPRCTGGLGSPRGPSTFQPRDQFQFTPSSVVEVTYRDRASLPNDLRVTALTDWI